MRTDDRFGSSPDAPADIATVTYSAHGRDESAGTGPRRGKSRTASEARTRPQARPARRAAPANGTTPPLIDSVTTWFELANFPVPSEDRLRQVFDLTPAEARLAQGLARGDTLEKVAEQLQIKITTARTQLAAIFAKTRTHRQPGLVALLSRLAHLDEFGWT
jgi:DNA-binding CsgD family transcriptional regulator